MSETTKRIDTPKVKTHQIMEIVAKSMFGLNNCDCLYYKKMVNRCAKKVLEYHNTHLHQEVIRGKIEVLGKIADILLSNHPQITHTAILLTAREEIKTLLAELEQQITKED